MNPRMRTARSIVAFGLLLCLLRGSDAARADAANLNGRYWQASYNAALSLHEAAVPKTYKVGSKLKVCYRNDSNCLVVTAHPGSCTCFDLSDEAFRKLAGSTAKGIITVSVVQR